MNIFLRSTAMKFLVLAAACMTLGGAASAADVANMLRYGIDDERVSVPNINRLPQVVAEREGFFAREGLKVVFVPFQPNGFRVAKGAPNAAKGPPPSSMRDAMLKGDIDMQRQQFPLLIHDVMAGGKFIGVSVSMSDPIYFLAVRPEVKSFADLKGKVVSITNPYDGITIWTRKLMALHGLKNEDTTLKDIAGNPGRLVCMNSGDCAAGTVGPLEMLEFPGSGFHSLGLTNEVGPPLLQVDVVNPAWATAHRDLVVKYIRATSAAMRFVIDPKNRDAVVKDTMAFMKQPEDHSRQMLSYILDPKNRVMQPTLDVNDVKGAISLLGEYGILKQPLPAPDRFVDTSYWVAAAK